MYIKQVLIDYKLFVNLWHIKKADLLCRSAFTNTYSIAACI